MSNPFFSVIIPTYNREAMLRRAINSVLAQNYQSFELLVVDDGSTDNTEKMVNSILDERLGYTKMTNSERGAARNAGICLARGRYVTFLDSDDFLYPHHLQSAHQSLHELSSPEVYHQGYVIMSDASKKVIKKPYAGVDVGKALFNQGNVMSCMGVFVRHDILSENLFNENRLLAGLEDWELWLRLASKFQIHYNRNVTSVLVHHDNRGSVLANRRNLEEKCSLFLSIVCSNHKVREKYGRFLNVLTANVHTYLSLHLSDNPDERRAAWQFLLKGIKEDLSQLLKKRTLVILRNVLLT